MTKQELKQIIIECINEISMSVEYRWSTFENLLAKGIKNKLKPPLQKFEDLDAIQEWANENIPKYGIIIDMATKKVNFNVKKIPDYETHFLYDDEYETLDDLAEDFAEDDISMTDGRPLWISPLHVAEYVLGQSIASKIAVTRDHKVYNPER